MLGAYGFKTRPDQYLSLHRIETKDNETIHRRWGLSVFRQSLRRGRKYCQYCKQGIISTINPYYVGRLVWASVCYRCQKQSAIRLELF